MPYISHGSCECSPPHTGTVFNQPLRGRKARKHAGSVWKCPRCKQLWLAVVKPGIPMLGGEQSGWIKTTYYDLRKREQAKS